MPRVIQPIQHIDCFLHQKVFLVWCIKLKHIQTNRVCHVGWIKIDNIFDTLFWHLTKKRLYQFSVLVNKRKASTIHHVLICHILLQDRLTDTSLTNDINVATTVFCSDANRFFNSTKFVITNQQAFVQNICRTINLLGHLTFNLRCWYRRGAR